MNIKRVIVGAFRTNCYIVENNDYLLVVDPGNEFSTIREFLTKEVTHIAITHAHFDHVGALSAMHEVFPKAEIVVGSHEKTDPKFIKDIALMNWGKFFGPELDEAGEILSKAKRLKDGDIFLDFQIIETPGHSDGSLCYFNKTEKVLFSGDTMFCGTYGRTDSRVFGSEENIKTSLKRLLTLPEDTVVYPGHGFSTTIANEKITYRYGM